MHKILLFSLAFFTFINVSAKQNIRLNQLSLDEGLSQGEVSSILQDNDGFLWLGTKQGLNLYDGHRIKIISGPDKLLEIQQINTLFQDSQDNIWIGSVPNRNFRLSKKDSTIKEFSPPFPKGRAVQDSAFFAIAEDQNNNLWMATLRAIFHYDSDTEKLTFVADFEPRLDSSELIRALYPLEKHLLVATSKGLYALNTQDSRVQEIPFINQMTPFDPDKSSDGRDDRDDRINVKGLYRNKQNNLLLATVEGLYEVTFDAIYQSLKEPDYSPPVKVLEPELNIWKLIEEDDFYWLATHQGLVRLSKNGEKFHILAYSDTPYQSADNNILALIKDNEGNLWMGSRSNGAFRWNPNQDLFTFYQQSNDTFQSLSHNQVWSTIEDNQGYIWVGTLNGLNRIDPKTNQVRQFLINSDVKAIVSAATITDIELQGNNLWLSTFEGIKKFDTESLTETPLMLTPELESVFTKQPQDLFFLDAEKLAIIHKEGLYTYNTRTGELSFNEKTESQGRLQKQLIKMTGQNPNNSDELYITMVDQVVAYSQTSGSYRVVHSLPPSDKPRTYAQDVYSDEKHTWIAYPGFGIYVIDNQTGKEVKQISSLDGLPDNSPLEFKSDKNGNLWVTSNSGLIRFNKDTFHFRVYDTNDGLAINEFNGGASLITKNGDFYFGSIKGVMKVDPDQLVPSNNERQLAIHITNVSLMSRVLPDVYSPLVEHQLNLSHNDYGLKLKFSALSFSNPKKLKYKYWIEGSSKTTPTVTNESELFLPKLEAGNSVFKISVIDYETGRESKPESLYLNVKPHPAFSWWAYSLYTLFLFTVFFIIYWQRRKRQLALLNAHQILKKSEERLQLALTGSNSGLWDWQSENNLVFEPRYKNKGSNGEYIEFESRLSYIHENERERYQKKWDEFINGNHEVFEFVYRMKTSNNDWAWFRDLARVTESYENGIPKRITGTYIDITQSKDDHDKVLLFSEAFQSTRDVVIITNSHLEVNAANSALYRATSYQEKNILGFSLTVLIQAENNTELTSCMVDRLKEKGHWEGEGRLTRLYRLPLPVLVTASAFTNEIGESRFVFAITDIAEQKQAQEKLRKLANYDALTGLPNRALLMDRITHAINLAKRNSKKLALFFIDLDRFKQINDSLGHDIGDLLLKNVTKVLTTSTRQNDTVARLGGDEFVIMLEEIEQIEVISRIAQSILQNISRPLQLVKHEVSISSSIGISIYPEDGTSADVLVKHADIAMYHAKNSGRNNFQFFTNKMNQLVQTRLHLENDLRSAIRNNEFVLYYQPKIALHDNKIRGFELLARWQKPDGTMIPPSDFIPFAEELGLIINITELLIVQAMKTMQQWIELGIETSFALNLSARHLHHYDLSQFVEDNLTIYRVPASSIEFELTESTIMKDMESAVKLLNNLKQQGIAISLDDFGTGYTSFKYLKDFPIDALKIDRSFVKDIGVDRKDEAIIDSIITLANKLGISTIAEGVETQQQADYLLKRNCPLAQGFLYSKPVPVEIALELITNEQTKIK